MCDVRLVHLRRVGVWCRECDALWVEAEPRDDNFDDYGTFMKRHGRAEPENPEEIEVLGQHQRTAWGS